MGGVGPDLTKAGEAGGSPTTTTTVPGAAPAPGGDLTIGAQDLGSLLEAAVRGAKTDEETKTVPIAEWLRSLFGGDLGRTDTQGTVPMSGLGSRGSTSSLADVIGMVASMSAAQLTYLQRRLFQAGFYADDVYANADQIQWGLVDQVTLAALQLAFTQAGTNQVADFDAFLSDQAARFRRTGLTASGTSLDPGGASGVGEVVNVELEDPDSIKLMAEQAGISLLGRKPTEEELAKVTAAIHGAQREREMAMARASASGATQLPDLSDEASLLADGGMAIPLDYDPSGSSIQRLTPEQFEVAGTIIQVGREMGLSEEYIVGALSAGIVESGLRNVNYGDRDSLGVFQQREQGYGSADRRLDVRQSATMFFQEMLRQRGDTLGEWVANTQRPAKQYRDRYAEKMNDAARIYTLVTGQVSRPANPRQGDLAISRLTGAPPPTPIGRGPGGMFRDEERKTSQATDVGPATGLPKEPAENPFWLDRYAAVGNSQQDPIFREIMGVDVNASIAEELKRLDPEGYATHQTAAKAYEFFSLLGAGGGA